MGEQTEWSRRGQRGLEAPVLPQSQAALNDQLYDLHVAANRMGLFDAADWLAELVPFVVNRADATADFVGRPTPVPPSAKPTEEVDRGGRVSEGPS